MEDTDEPPEVEWGDSTPDANLAFALKYFLQLVENDLYGSDKPSENKAIAAIAAK